MAPLIIFILTCAFIVIAWKTIREAIGDKAQAEYKRECQRQENEARCKAEAQRDAEAQRELDGHLLILEPLHDVLLPDRRPVGWGQADERPQAALATTA